MLISGRRQAGAPGSWRDREETGPFIERAPARVKVTTLNRKLIIACEVWSIHRVNGLLNCGLFLGYFLSTTHTHALWCTAVQLVLFLQCALSILCIHDKIYKARFMEWWLHLNRQKSISNIISQARSWLIYIWENTLRFVQGSKMSVHDFNYVLKDMRLEVLTFNFEGNWWNWAQIFSFQRPKDKQTTFSEATLLDTGKKH